MKNTMETDAEPLISVLMGVYNCEKTLDESLSCLLEQTEPRWELVICDDGSVDGTAEVIRAWQRRFPDRITFLQNEENQGLSRTLNHCLRRARGVYAARMDGDDRCSPDRFEKELKILEEHPDLAVVSTDMLCFDENGVWGRSIYPTNPQPADLVHGVPFCHAACMVRTEVLRSLNGYSEEDRFERVEDYELWTRLYAAGWRGTNLHEGLYQMRDDRNAASRRKWKYRLNEARVRLLAVERLSLPKWMAVYALRPLILGLVPARLQSSLHRSKLSKEIP